MILVDTSAWSFFLRRKKRVESPLITILTDLVANDEPIYLCGIVYQEVLQGIRNKKQYDTVKSYLDQFNFLQTDLHVHHLAAQVFNKCQDKGVSASTVDCLIAALALFHDCFLLTLDNDFQHMARCVNLKLVSV